MVYLWFVKIKLGMDTLESVPERYFEQVKEMLVADGLLDPAPAPDDTGKGEGA